MFFLQSWIPSTDKIPLLWDITLKQMCKTHKEKNPIKLLGLRLLRYNNTMKHVHLCMQAFTKLDYAFSYPIYLQDVFSLVKFYKNKIRYNLFCIAFYFINFFFSNFPSADIASKAGAIICSHLDPFSTMKTRMKLEKREISPTPSPLFPSMDSPRCVFKWWNNSSYSMLLFLYLNYF